MDFCPLALLMTDKLEIVMLYEYEKWPNILGWHQTLKSFIKTLGRKSLRMGRAGNTEKSQFWTPVLSSYPQTFQRECPAPVNPSLDTSLATGYTLVWCLEAPSGIQAGDRAFSEPEGKIFKGAFQIISDVQLLLCLISCKWITATRINLSSGRKTNYKRLHIGFLLRWKEKRRQREEGGKKWCWWDRCYPRRASMWLANRCLSSQWTWPRARAHIWTSGVGSGF